MKMTDVAKALGVSRVTVSRVLNGHETVSQKTKKKVLEYVKQTGYQPHFAARMLSKGTSHVIGIVCAHASAVLVSHILTTVLNELARQGREAQMLLANDVYSEKAAIISLTRRTVSGLIVFSNFCDSDFLDKITKEQKNIVFNGLGPKRALSVRTDHIKGMHQVMTYLLQLGHKQIHYIGAPQEMQRVGQDERRRGYLECMQEFQYEPSMSFAQEVDVVSGYKETKNILLTVNPHPTAIVCYNDELAFGAIRAATELGIKVPEQVSITGYDGIDIFSYGSPSLTTYKIDPVVIGKSLVRTLVGQMNTDKKRHGNIWYSGELIIGESTGRAGALD
jgi:LacI family purine nucleotide synthesis repressor